MKKTLAILLALTMLVSLTACGGSEPAEDSTTTTAATTTTTTEATTTTTTEAIVDDTTTADTQDTAVEDTTTTEAPTTTTTKAPTTTTTTTKAPTTTTTTTVSYPPVPESISILSVGNSFSVDAMRHHLYQMLQDAGYKNIHLGILYIGGASIDTHYENVKFDRAKYQYQENKDGTWTYTEEYKASTAFALTDWDYVTVQQVSSDSGRPISYGNLDALMDLIQPQIGDAKVYWHMTWAYQQDSDHSAFGNYNKDQTRMYKGIVDAYKRKIKDNPDFVGVFPSGTSIQNLRTSGLGDTLTADGYHLLDTYGDYTAALTWLCVLTGRPAASTGYRPATISDYFDEIAQSVDNAIANPYAVTPCK